MLPPVKNLPQDPAFSPEHVEGLIEQAFDALSPELQRAARWVRQHGTSLALHSMRNSARQAGVAPATMTRLAQRLGFDGFEALREPFVRRLADGPALQATALPALRKERALAAVVQDLNQAQQAHVAAVVQANALDQLVAAADAMLSARSVFFLGMRVSHGIAFQMHYAHSLLAANGNLLTHLGGTLSDQMLQVTEGSLLVAISQTPYSRMTVEAVQTARRQGARVLALTDSRLAPMAREATHLLLFDGNAGAHFHSTTGALALIETLLCLVMERGGDSVRDFLAMRQQRLQNERAYWEVPGRQGSPVSGTARRRLPPSTSS
ncbi:MAG: MurR/RpiR family transcriptional regulator [Rubrivivax sp.]|jgi:DNA-binding MurR/RpiR family transcriptional regulator|nr:MurR/RpiR family transcriptional regulator [Rubrivivax sp.]